MMIWQHMQKRAIKTASTIRNETAAVALNVQKPLAATNKRPLATTVSANTAERTTETLRHIATLAAPLPARINI